VVERICCGAQCAIKRLHITAREQAKAGGWYKKQPSKEH
jgi:hypothetical protein